METSLKTFFPLLAFGESANINLQAEFLLFHLMDPKDFLMPLPLSSVCVLVCSLSEVSLFFLRV